jgi:2-oxoglutarate ferredoxin oxidoreductase subunit gamma
MQYEVLCAGFGGQGVLYLGDLIAQAALNQGLHVAYLPTYGVAMRGGTANCMVTIADDEIGSPLLDHPHAAILLNQPSFDKYQPMLRKGGLAVVNATLVKPDSPVCGDDMHVVWTPATRVSRETTGNDRAANMVALGAFLRAQKVIAPESVEALLRTNGSPKKQEILQKNLAAFRAGLDLK